MKKATLTIGLFSLVTVLASFTSPINSKDLIIDNTVITSIDGIGTQYDGGIKINKTNQVTDIDGTGSQDTGRTKKLD
jgi:hypothetical protein